MPLTPEDRLAVHDLMMRYARTVDFAAGSDTERELSDIFTPDALIDGPYGRSDDPVLGGAGAAGIKQLADRVTTRGAWAQSRHTITNEVIDGDGDTASFKAYFVAYLTERRATPPRRFVSSELTYVGTYTNEMVKCDDGKWRIRRRFVTVDAPPDTPPLR
jgi:hypothetical protein